MAQFKETDVQMPVVDGQEYPNHRGQSSFGHVPAGTIS